MEGHLCPVLLRSTALEYFEPSILDSNDTPNWMDDWSAFLQILHVQFGPIDPTADAEDGIDNLKMQDNQHIVKYNVEFNCLAISTSWDDCQRTPQSISHYSRHLRQSPMHPSTQMTEPLPAARDPTIV